MELKALADHTNVIKFLLWPIFLAGTECTRCEHSGWILQNLGRLWGSNFVANSKNATFVSTTLWAKQDKIEQQVGSNGPKMWD